LVSRKCSVCPSRPAALFPFPAPGIGVWKERSRPGSQSRRRGVDTLADVHVAAMVDQVGRVLGSEAFRLARLVTALRWPG
jgi:hypothetical protein